MGAFLEIFSEIFGARWGTTFQTSGCHRNFDFFLFFFVTFLSGLCYILILKVPTPNGNGAVAGYARSALESNFASEGPEK